MNFKNAIAVVALVCMPVASQAMSYNVCVQTSRHINAIHNKFQQGRSTAAQEIADMQQESDLLPDTRKLLTYMYKYAEKRSYMHPFDFSQAAFVACLEFEPQWASY